MFPALVESIIKMSGALAVGGYAFSASTTESTGFVSTIGNDCCDSPHPTSTTAAIVVIVVISSFICFQFSILHLSCRRVCGRGSYTPTTRYMPILLGSIALSGNQDQVVLQTLAVIKFHIVLWFRQKI